MLKQGLTLLIAGVLVLALGSAMAAERYMYKWKGEDGELHYTERPPKDIPYEKIRVQQDDRHSTPASTALGKADQSKDDVKVADDSYQSWRKDNCQIAQQNLDILQNAGRISTDDGEGGKRLMTDEEKEANKKKAQQAMEKYCESDKPAK